MQIFIPLGQSFSIEICVTDLSQNHRRFFLSSSHKEVKVTALHVNLPLNCLKRGQWLNLSFDLPSLVSENFNDQVFRSIDSITICGTFRLRKVFTLKKRPPDTSGDDYIGYEFKNEEMDVIPKAVQFPIGVEHLTQVINMKRIMHSIQMHRSCNFVFLKKLI